MFPNQKKGDNMSKHLTLDDRIVIENSLKERKSFKEIGRSLNKDCTTISKEVRKHREELKKGAWGNAFNACLHRVFCDEMRVCGKEGCHKRCKNCPYCNSYCSDFEEEKCQQLNKPPYVCNGCKKRTRCTLVKQVYVATSAHEKYQTVLSESRSGINITEEELQQLRNIIVPLIKQGQSFHHISVNNADTIMMSEKTLYNYNDIGAFGITNIDLPRKVRYRKRKKRGNVYKVDKKCRINRTFDDFKEYLHNQQNCTYAQMDTVEGTKGGKVLLTIHFPQSSFMLAYLRDANDSKSVTLIFEKLFSSLGADNFEKLFPVILTDNGSEFSNPKAIEFIDGTKQRTRIFYCDPQSPFQKPEIENNHEMLRRIIPKGTSLNNFDQSQIDLIINHINSYARESLNNKSPYEVFTFIYGTDVTEKLGVEPIPPNNIVLTPNLQNKTI